MVSVAFATTANRKAINFKRLTFFLIAKILDYCMILCKCVCKFTRELPYLLGCIFSKASQISFGVSTISSAGLSIETE